MLLGSFLLYGGTGEQFVLIGNAGLASYGIPLGAALLALSALLASTDGPHRDIGATG